MWNWLARRFRRTSKIPNEERIRRLAHDIWEKEGQPSGLAEAHWRIAEQIECHDNPTRPPSLGSTIARQFQSDLAEVQLLLDFISGRSEKGFARRSAIPSPTTAVETDRSATASVSNAVSTDEITIEEIKRISAIRYPPPPSRPVEANAEDAALLISIRNKLNQLVYPASGLTIAFTICLWSPLLSMVLPLRKHREWARWHLANQAFPRLGYGVGIFKITTFVLTVSAVLILLGTTLLSFAAADGAAKLKRVQAAEQKQIEIVTLIRQFEGMDTAPNRLSQVVLPSGTAGASSGGARQQALVVRYCERTLLIEPRTIGEKHVALFDNAPQYQTCDSLARLQVEKAAAQHELSDWRADWESSWFTSSGCWLLRSADCGRMAEHRPSGEQYATLGGIYSDRTQSDEPRTPFQQSPAEQEWSLDTQAYAQDTLAALTGIWLPMSYGFIGAMVAALRSVFTKISNSTLAPWDTRLLVTRVILGIMAGGCVGLFFGPTGSSVPGAPSTLSLSAIAFLAGYAVDGLFSMLDQIIQRIFRLEPEASAPRRA